MTREYKCPSCGSSMVFDSSLKQMLCEHCGTARTVEQMEELWREEEQTQADDIYEDIKEEDSYGNETGDFKKYTCPSCGAEILTDEHTAATFCSFCGSPSLMEDRLTGERTPAYLIPFCIDKNKAVELYRKWCKKGMLTPKDFYSASTVEKLTGIYVPFWLYDYAANAVVEASCTRVRSERRGDTQYTHTDHYRVLRDVSDEYVKVPADASEKMPDQVMDKLEPFEYRALEPFQMGYLSGYLAEKFNYNSEQLKSRVENRISDYILKEAVNSIQGYSTKAITSQKVRFRPMAAKYTMLPVWILNYRYKEKDYMFAINGQTGKLVGKLPISMGKAAGVFLGISAASYLILTLIGGLV